VPTDRRGARVERVFEHASRGTLTVTVSVEQDETAAVAALDAAARGGAGPGDEETAPRTAVVRRGPDGVEAVTWSRVDEARHVRGELWRTGRVLASVVSEGPSDAAAAADRIVGQLAEEQRRRIVQTLRDR
jgi:hypothetical protein